VIGHRFVPAPDKQKRPQVIVDEILVRFLTVQDPSERRRQDDGGG